MIYAWEDPLYVARRLLRFASEDIWLADTHAFILANTTYDAIQKIWMPECDIFLFELAIYLARAPKNNLVYTLSHEVKDDVKKYWNLWVPLHLRNANTKLMKDIGYWKWYKYAHDFKDTKVEQEHFPDELKGRKYIKE
jgi:putative ATPase